MKRTIADVMRDEGREIGLELGRREEAISSRQQILLRLLRIRFGDIAEATVATVEACRDIDQLKAWLERFAVAKTLGGVRIRASSARHGGGSS